MSPQGFERLIAGVTGQIAARPLDDALDAWLNADWPKGSPTVAGGEALVLYLLPQGAIQFTPPA